MCGRAICNPARGQQSIENSSNMNARAAIEETRGTTIARVFTSSDLGPISLFLKRKLSFLESGGR